MVLLLLAACAQQVAVEEDQTGTQPQKGRTVFTITDAAADMGAVSSVKVTIDSIKVHSAAEGWVDVSSTAKTYDLLQLKAQGSQALLADIQLEEGTYDQIRLDVSSVVVTDANGQQEAKLPSGELKIIGNLVVDANSTSTATFDFIADESLHVTGNGKYVMAPVVKLETKEDADVSVKSDNTVEIKGGNLKTSVKVGMDENGNVGVGRKISSDSEVSIESDKIKVKTKVMIG